MEKIQSAIAKARAARAAQIAGASAPAVTHAPPLVLSNPVQPVATAPVRSFLSDPTAVAALWAALPAFAPPPALMARHHIVTFEGGREAVHFDVMRTRLLQQMRANGWHRVAITSPGPACGKSTVALNLAFSLGRQPDLRTILCEMDLRRPSLARMLGLRAKHSFARVLEGTAPLSTQALRHGPNLAVASQTGPARRPAELLHSPTVATVLDAIETDWNPSVMIFDMPPMLASDDALAVMGQMDCALIIAAAESTTIAEIDRCEREIAGQTNVLGVVLNKCRYMNQDYEYDYYGG